MTFGYDTRIKHFLGSPKSKNTVSDISWDLLVGLEVERRSDPNRALLFVAHSLGGIVTKEALRRSYGCQMHQPHLRTIYEATRGIVFFGTPHSGADPRGIIQHIIQGLAKIAGFSPNEQIVATLLPSSERLRELRNEFGPMAHQQKWTIYSFQEEYGVKLLNNKKVGS